MKIIVKNFKFSLLLLYEFAPYSIHFLVVGSRAIIFFFLNRLLLHFLEFINIGVISGERHLWIDRSELTLMLIERRRFRPFPSTFPTEPTQSTILGVHVVLLA